MIALALTTGCFIIFNYNMLSIWFSFFLNLSCYLSPFFWENQFFFLIEEFSYLINKILNYDNFLFFHENIIDLDYENFFFYYENKNSEIIRSKYDKLFNKYKNVGNFYIVFDSSDKSSYSTGGRLDKFYLLLLEATTSRLNLVDFYCLQDRQIILAGETSLSFYRIYNRSLNDILFYSVYIINPSVLSLYLVKVQCFCFEEILINSSELINLPVLVYLDNGILLENQVYWVRIIYLEYIALIKETMYL